MPEISAADIMARAAIDATRAARSYIDEDKIKELLGTGDRSERLFAYYLGNPHLHDIRPLRDAPLRAGELLGQIAHPIIFVSGGDQPHMKDIFEGTTAERDALKQAAGLRGGVKLYDPHLDRQLIGTTDVEDYFMPLNTPATYVLEALRSAGRRVKEIKPPGPS